MSINFYDHSITTSGTITSPSGNFTTLVVNGTSVSNFNSSVSGLLPTIANSGDNRILTSTGSTLGINAEANLTFDGGILAINSASTAATYGGSLRIGPMSSGSLLSNGGLEFVNAASSNGWGWRIANLDAGAGSVPLVFQNRSNSTSWSEVLRITEGGNVGIGTSSPSTKLDVFGTAGGGATIRINDGTQDLRLYTSTGIGVVGTISNSSLGFHTNNTERMRITSDGNVGIGTSTPTFVNANYSGLHIHAATATSLKLTNTTAGQSATDGFELLQDVSANAYIWNRENTFLSFATNSTERMRIDSAGNVGIGTTSPTQKLHITGVLRIGGGGNQSTGEINLDDGVTQYTGNAFQIRKDSSSYWALKSVTAGNDLALFVDNTVARGLYIANTTGNVGIGTTSPATRLHVAGTSSTFNGLLLTTTAAGGGVYASIEIGTYYPTWTVASPASLRFIDDNNFSTHITFRTKTSGSASNGDVERFRITSAGNTEIRANAGNVSSAFVYNENGGELVHYDETQTAATLLDQSSNQTRLLELVNGSNLVLGLGSSNTTGSIVFVRAGYNEAMRIDSTGAAWMKTTRAWNDTVPTLSIGNDADGRLQTRHIWGKASASAAAEHLWLQHGNTNNHVQIGATGGGNNLYVVGNIYANGYFGGNLVLNAGNYNSYAPTLTGGGASGTWGINVTGTAASETLATVTGRGASTTTNITTTGAMFASNWYRSYGATGWYNETYGGGIWMSDSTWVKVYNNKQFFADNIIQSAASVRAPIFYDTDNTAFYCDPNGTSRFAGLVITGTDLYVGDGVTSSIIRMRDSDEGERQLHCNSNRIGFLNQSGGWGSWCEDDGSWATDFAVYAPIFYDRNNTAYYLDPASTSVLNRVNPVGWDTSGRNYSREWIEFTNHSGLYSSLNAAHFYPNNASYGPWRIAGTRNGWAGLEFDSTGAGQISLMMNSGHTGVHNNTYGWQWYWTGGAFYVSTAANGGGTILPVTLPGNNSSVKAWCRFNGTAASPISVTNGYNVTNITRLGTGSYQINLSITIAGSNYCAVASSTTVRTSVVGVNSTQIFVDTFSGTGSTAVNANEVHVVAT